MGSVVLLCVLLSALHALWTPGVRSQSLPERNGLCGEDGCFVVYFQRKTFLEAWRSCKEKGGNLATMKLPAEARQVEELLAGAVRRGSRAKVRVWIGLQRQPRQCSATRPLRGFSWTTGDQDTQYTNWLREDSPSTCSAPRCVVTTHSTANHEARDNYKWLDGSCSLPVDGFLCRFVYEKGMCQPIPGEGGPGPVMYNTPFQLLSARLTHIPFGSMATVPCPDGPTGDQSVLCVAKEDGMAGWHQDGPFCTEPSSKSWCQEDNGGCEHLCVEANDHYYCECPPEFRLAEDRHSCIPLNPCRDAPCEHDCVQLTEGYRCTCQGGFQLAPDGIGCVDEDECLDSPCEQACENRHGSYTCHCHLGFFPLPEDPARCQDVDECQFEESCEQMCVNYIGGFQCHCREGYELQPDYSSCRAVPDTDKSPTAAPSFSWVTDLPENSWFPQLPEGHWPSETIPREWLTDRPHLEGLPTDLTGPTDVPAEQEREPVDVEEPGEGVRTEDRDRADEHDRWEQPYRPEEEGREDENDRQQKPYRPEEKEVQHELEGPDGSNDKGAQSWAPLDQLALTTSPSATSTPDSYEYSEEGIDQLETPPPLPEEAEPSWDPTSSPQTDGVVISDEGYGDGDGDGDKDGDEADPDPHTPEPSTEGPPESGSNKQQGNRWLLIALLVPLCIFLVVMVVLGIVYCTRCSARARSKNNKDCYHWISGANDKAGSPGAAKV
ncbi:hypothetical protein COCON_G00043330 [Conger conger]|uniref:Endosialin n=1 Tax=Conger conger TaxID=82655 RepID=A0A9Q1DUF7_CONCO|nr:hypothetical protein COCON_G00043330 [Conger conger]